MRNEKKEPKGDTAAYTNGSGVIAKRVSFVRPRNEALIASEPSDRKKQPSESPARDKAGLVSGLL